MKMLLSSLLLLSGLPFGSIACRVNDDVSRSETTVPTPDPNPSSERALVVYFSCTNTTAAFADRISELTGAQTWRIVPQVPYSSADLNYNDSASRANRELNDPSARPAISGQDVDLSNYEVVFLGYPIWWGKAPKIISTFLESADFAGKTIVPFCTSGSSGIGASDTELHTLAPQAVWRQGRRFSGRETNEAIKRWIEGLR